MEVDEHEVKEAFWQLVESCELALIASGDGTTYIEAGRIRVRCEHCGEVHGMPPAKEGTEDGR